jgi:hypothetical protein
MFFIVTSNSLFRANNPGLMTRTKKIDTFWIVEAPQGKFQDLIIWSSKIPAGTSTQAALQQLFGLGLFFVLFLINNVATPPPTPAKAFQLADEEEKEEEEEEEREKEKEKGKEKERRTRTGIQREVKEEEDEKEGEEEEKEEGDEAKEAESSTKEREEGRKPMKAEYKQFCACAGNKCAKKLEALFSTPLFCSAFVC